MATIAERWMQEGEQKEVEKGIEKGIKKGVIKGKRENSLQIAQQMKQDGMDMPLISKYTGLSISEIEALEEAST